MIVLPEAITELGLVIGLFFAIVGYVVARGLLATWNLSLGFVLAWLAAHARIPIPTGLHTYHVDFGGPFRAVDAWAVTALQNWSKGAELEMGYCLHGMEKVARFTAQAIDLLARETSQAFDWLLSVHLPKWSRSIVALAYPPALLARLIAAAAAHLRPLIVRTLHVVEHAVPSTVTRVVHTVTSGAIALPKWVIHLPAGIRSLERDFSKLGKRVRRLEKVLGAATFAALMANAIGGVTARCIRNGNIGRTARLLCGLDSGVLSTLLAGFAIVEGGFSIQELAREALAIEDDLVKGVKLLVTELEPL